MNVEYRSLRKSPLINLLLAREEYRGKVVLYYPIFAVLIAMLLICRRRRRRPLTGWLRPPGDGLAKERNARPSSVVA